MKDRICNVLIVLAMLALVGAGFREYLIHNGRLTSDMNADGHSITNLPGGFFPVESVNGMTGAVTVPPTDLAPYALKSELPTDYITENDITNFATRAWISAQGYATEAGVGARIDAQDLAIGAATNSVWQGVRAASNELARADARLDAKITSATNALVIAAVDLSTSNALLVATIEAVAPVPGNYANVSNAAMIAGRVATNYTDAAIAKLSQTNPVLTGGPYLQTSSNELDHTVRVQYGTGPSGFTFSPSEIYVPGAAFFESFWITSNDNRGPLSGIGQYGGAFSSARSEMENFVTSSLSEYATHAQVLAAASSATNYTDGAISTNNAAFVSAVLAVPLTGADAGDLAELAEYGGYGTVGAAIVALIAGLAALKRRMGAAEEAIEGKVSASELPYALVTPGEWEFSGVPRGWSVSGLIWSEIEWVLYLEEEGTGTEVHNYSTSPESSLQLIFNVSVGGGSTITATRASLPGHLLDRAGNEVEVTGTKTLTLPAAAAGYARDFIVRLEISGSTVPTITFAAPTGETIVYETDGDDFPVPDEAGTWLYSFTETKAGVFAVALKSTTTVAQA